MKEVDNYESRLLLFRELKETDAQKLFKIYSDKEAMKYRSNPPMEKMEDATSFILNQKRETSLEYKIRKGIELKANKELIGSVLYKYNKKKENECVIGYSIGRDYWGQGIGRKVVKNLLESLRIQRETRIVKAWISKENLASKRVIEINGFQLLHQEEFSELDLYVRKI